MKTLIIVLLAALVALPLSAAMVAKNNGDGTTTFGFMYTVTTTNMPTISAELCAAINYQSTVACTQAMVTASTCTQAQLGTQITNPQTCPQALDAFFRHQLRQMVRKAKIDAAKKTNVDPIKTSTVDING